MEFKNDLPEWDAPGVEPPKSLREEGYKPQNKPPADYFNWFFYKTYQSLLNITQNAQHASEKGQPDGYASLDAGGKVPSNQLSLTKSQVGLDNVDNVKQASKTDFDNHVDNEKHLKSGEREKWNKAPSKDEMTTELNKKVDKVTGKGLSSNDYTTGEKTKLEGIEVGANKYTHPPTHPASMITESSTRRFVTDAERTKLEGVETGANKYVHPETHPASMITESPDRQFVTATKKTEWDGKETPSGAQEKVNALAGTGNTKTVKQLDKDFAAHSADYTQFKSDTESNIEDLQNDINNIELKAEKVELNSDKFDSTDVLGGMEELFTNVSDGKSIIGTAITDVDEDVDVPNNPTFEQLVDAIGQIKTGFIQEVLPGNTIIYNDPTETTLDNNHQETFVKMEEVKVIIPGTYRVGFAAKSYSSWVSECRIYVDGNPVGITRELKEIRFIYFFEDITVNENQTIQIFGRKQPTHTQPSKPTIKDFSLGIAEYFVG